MKITIIIPVYNVAAYIGECLQSVMSQTYNGGDMECILVDDCGQDNSIAIAEKEIEGYNGKIDFHIVHHEINKGPSAARNTGMLCSTGDYLYFLDSDDSITPDCIKQLAAFIEKYGGVDIIQGSSRTNGNKAWTCFKPNLIPEYTDNTALARKLIHSEGISAPWNKLFRKSLVIENNVFFDEDLANHEDDLWRYRLSKYIKDIAFCYTCTYIYRADNLLSITHAKDFTPDYLACLKIVSYVINNFDESNRFAELHFLGRKLDTLFYDKKERWSLIDHTAVKEPEKRAYRAVIRSNLPLRMRLKTLILMLPQRLMGNRIGKAVYLWL